jgi:hypothetical protein
MLTSRNTPLSRKVWMFLYTVASEIDGILRRTFASRMPRHVHHRPIDHLPLVGCGQVMTVAQSSEVAGIAHFL